MLEKELKEASEEYHVNKLLCRMHNVLPIGVLKDLWWDGHHFFRDSGSVHYNELITYWILEGYLGSGSMTELYEKGHHIVMELTDCGILKEQEGGCVFKDKSLLNIDDLYQCLDQIASLGLATVFMSNTEGFGRITHEEGMLKTPWTSVKGMNHEQKQSLKKGDQNLSTLLLDGTHFDEDVLVRFLQSEKELQVLALFNPTIKSLPNPLAMMDMLRVLVLRDCVFLEDLNLSLKALRVLEISGAISLNELKQVHLSELQITSLPESVYSLAELQWLVVKDCPHLTRVKNLAKLKHLMVLDLSGNVSLDYVDKNFLECKNLQILNLSNTMVSTTPLLRNLEKLTHLLLCDCKKLGRLRSLTSLGSLQLLISLALPILKSSKNLNDIEDDFFDRMTCLRVLNLSETNVKVLPSLSNLSNLRELFLSHCPSLIELSSLESATRLEVLDVSHCGSLEDIAYSSFERMIHLQKLDLSETKIKNLPALPNPSSLRQLVLKNCSILQNLELNASLLNLEVLNLAGIASLAPNGAELVKDMCNLQILDLSHTPLEQLPSMSNLKKLAHLSLAAFTTLHKLLLKDCVMVEDVPDVEVNDLLAPILRIPHEISQLCHLDYLELPSIKDIPGVDSNRVGCLSEEMNEDQWNICQLSDSDKPPLFLSGTQFLQILKKSPSPRGGFHLCAFPVMVEGEIGDRYLRRRELVFADVYLRTGQLAQYNRSLQIRGFNHSPKGIENIISHVNLVFLIDNKFKSLLSGLSASVLDELKGCWIERCDEMVSIFDEKERELGIAMENLGVSNNRRLASIYNGNQPFGSFNNVKTLYLESCPEVSTVFSSSWLPKTLKVLQIKYCEKIVSLSEADSELELPLLETLHLWELPELTRIGVLCPSLQTLKICACPKLKEIEEYYEFAKGLKTLWISAA
ncbi:hypothetical protein L6452_31742 [Arctium lappa]|uniref:Uncharacterized protein n=1 Tax=Arctium lappa TaxID=4217 RepID=A0ACB8Z2P8_ARCLA|nr:hypothetical protein L6452_31742 [Arctium lappa]